MEKMRKLQIACLAVMMMLVMVPVAQADPIYLTQGDAYYVGYIDDGIPSGLANDRTYLTNLLTLAAGNTGTTIGSEIYYRVGSTLNSLPGVPLTGTLYEGITVGPTLTVDSITYVMAKYDGPNFGVMVWYLGGLNSTDVVVIPTYPYAERQQYGISNYATFGGTSVPEPATILLLGLGLVGMAGIGRKMR